MISGFVNRSFPSPSLYQTREPRQYKVKLGTWEWCVVAYFVQSYKMWLTTPTYTQYIASRWHRNVVWLLHTFEPSFIGSKPLRHVMAAYRTWSSCLLEGNQPVPGNKMVLAGTWYQIGTSQYLVPDQHPVLRWYGPVLGTEWYRPVPGILYQIRTSQCTQYQNNTVLYPVPASTRLKSSTVNSVSWRD